jgi:hypothetical protein
MGLCFFSPVWFYFKRKQRNKKRVNTMKVAVYWDVIPCGLSDIYQHFGGIYYLHLLLGRWQQQVLRNVGKRLPDHVILSRGSV